jgi:hypothetical protein
MDLVKCPCCDGTGLTTRPPWVPGDQPYWTDSNAGPYTCGKCQGSGMFILDPTCPPGIFSFVWYG